MAEVFEICVTDSFSAAHSLEGYLGECARLHGHSFDVEVFIRCSALDKLGMGVDFNKASGAVREALSGLDHANLNDLAAFRVENPTAENIARHIYHHVSGRLNGPDVKVSRVRVWEGRGASASYWVE